VGGVFACSDRGIREAIAVGGGPHTFDCDGAQTVTATVIIDNDVILDGEGNLTLTGVGDQRVVLVSEGTTAELRGFGITNGWSDAHGGGIANEGNLTLADSSVSNNDARWGAGISNLGMMTLNRITMKANGAHFQSSAIENVETMTIVDCVIYENPAGIINFGELTMRNSTVTGNGAGIVTTGALALTNTTVSANPQSGILVFHGTVALLNSTVADGIHANVLFEDSPRTILAAATLIHGACEQLGDQVSWISHGYNVESPGDTCGFDQPTDKASISPDDLKLGPLQDNGGSTETHALLAGSIALDVIPGPSCVDANDQPLTTDQRGEPRPEPGGTMCDVGAFELQR
jgi:hypothetical protein